MASDRSRLLPRLATDHPGYFKVAAALVLIHIGLTFDSFLAGPKHSPGFIVVVESLNGQLYLLAISHMLIAVLLLAGLYWHNHFYLLRYGCALSLVLFNVLAVGFAIASIRLNLSFYPSMAAVTLSLSSLAAIKEPSTQTARREWD